MDDKDHIVSYADLVPQGEQIVPLFGVGITVGSGVIEFFAFPHANEITGDQAAQTLAMGHNVAP